MARLYSELEVLEPDLVLVYSGHNELLRWQAREGTTATAEGLSASLLRRSTIARWLQRWIGVGASSEARGSELSLAEQVAQVTVYDPVEAPTSNHHRPSASTVAAAARDYATNIQSIADRAQATGTRTLFVLPVPNLMYPPAVSVHEGTVDQAEHRALELRIQEAYARRDAAEAVGSVDQAIELSPSFAMNHYWKGLIELGQGREGLAKQSLQRALDLDVRTHRISSPFEDTFVELMKLNDLEWVDVRETFQSSVALLQPQAFFLDWVHPTPQGHELCACLGFAVGSRSMGTHRLSRSRTWAAVLQYGTVMLVNPGFSVQRIFRTYVLQPAWRHSNRRVGWRSSVGQGLWRPQQILEVLSGKLRACP